MTIKEDNKKSIDTLLEGVRKNFDNDGYVMAVTFIISFDKKLLICPADYKNDIEKEQYAKAIKQMAKEYSAVAVIFAAEAYALVSKMDNPLDEVKKYGRVKNCPGRREVIMISEEYSDGEQFTTMIPIIREGEKVSLGVSETNSMKGSQGIFTNMINRPSADDLLKDIK